MNIHDLKERSRFLGSAEQMYGVRRFCMDEGKAKGCAFYQVRTGAGLTYTVNADAGLDLAELSFRGVDLHFLSKNGHHSPYAFNTSETEAMHSFPGGMMYTCGLMNVGGGNRDADGVWHPMHGRFHATPAVQVGGRVADDETLVVEGVIRDTRLFGQAIEVHRTIESKAGSTELLITDTIVNQTPNDVGFMLLYHTNFGFPFLSKDLQMEVEDLTLTEGRSPFATENIKDWMRFTDPVDNMDEQVFFHEVDPANEWGTVVLKNPTLKIGVKMKWSNGTLPRLAEWKCMRSGEYVLGLEPTNCRLMGRQGESEAGCLPVLKAFETVQTKISLTFFDL